MKKLYNHLFSIAFEVETNLESPYDCVRGEPQLIRYALLERIAGLTDEDLNEALGWEDTVEEEEA